MTEDARSDLAEAVRWLRERIGLSRDQLAAASGVSAVHIKFIERGKRNPSEAVVQRLLPALRVNRHDLDGLLSLRPWARSTASGDPATLSTYAAGVPLAVVEGSEFDARQPPPEPPPPPAQPMAAAGMPASAPPSARAQSLRFGAYRASAPGPPAAAPPPPPPPPTPQPPSAPEPPPTLDAELLELRERYVHLPRSRQEMVLGWLRALDDR